VHPKAAHLPARSDDINQKLTLPTFVVAKMVNLGCDGRHKNARFIVAARAARRSPTTIALLGGQICCVRGLAMQAITIDRDAGRIALDISHIACAPILGRNCISQAPTGPLILLTWDAIGGGAPHARSARA